MNEMSGLSAGIRNKIVLTMGHLVAAMEWS